MAGASKISPICIVFGKNRYARRAAVEGIVARELGGSDPGVNVSIVDGKSVDAASVLDDVRTFSLLGDRRVVVVEDADGFVSKYRGTLEKYAGAPSDSGCLVLVAEASNGNTKFHKAVMKVGEVVRCDPVKGRALLGWLLARARDGYGKRLDGAAAARLMDHVGASQEGLDSELAKLALYVGDRGAISADDVTALVGAYREQNVFAVMDAIAEGDVRTAIREWEQVLATDRAAPGRAIGGLAWSVRKLLDARAKLDGGASAQEVSRLLWTDVATMQKRLGRWSVAKLERVLEELLEADLGSKTGLGTVPSAIERFIVRQCVAA